jgi:heme o synthase
MAESDGLTIDPARVTDWRLTTGTQRAGVRAAVGARAGTARQLASDLVTLTKPRIISLLLVTALVPMMLAAGGWPGTALVLWTMVGCYLIAGAANTLNMVLDRDIDALMGRTALRPIPSGRLRPRAAVLYAAVLAMAALHILGAYVNPLTAALALGGLIYYVVIYTWWLKRRTPQNIVIGGGAGAMLPLIGWAAASGTLSATAALLFVVVVLWTPPHFWALALVKREDYARAGVPMAPCVWGARRTLRQMLVYGTLLVAATLALAALPGPGFLYLTAALLLGSRLLRDLVRLYRAPDPTPLIWPAYKFSLSYLALLFGALALDLVVRG